MDERKGPTHKQTWKVCEDVPKCVPGLEKEQERCTREGSQNREKEEDGRIRSIDRSIDRIPRKETKTPPFLLSSPTSIGLDPPIPTEVEEPTTIEEKRKKPSSMRHNRGSGSKPCRSNTVFERQHPCPHPSYETGTQKNQQKPTNVRTNQKTSGEKRKKQTTTKQPVRTNGAYHSNPNHAHDVETKMAEIDVPNTSNTCRLDECIVSGCRKACVANTKE